jgi:hypothetical protein
MWFRWGHAAFLIVMGGLCGFYLVPALHRLADWIARKRGQATKTAPSVDGEYIVDGDKKVKKTKSQ